MNLSDLPHFNPSSHTSPPLTPTGTHSATTIDMFHVKPLLISALLAISTASAAPAAAPSTFFLVTTSSRSSSASSSALPSVSALSLFDPYYQPAYLLRTIDAGYGSLPTFTLSDGALHTVAAGPHGIGEFEYVSTAIAAGQPLRFLAAQQPTGGLALKQGYLLTVDGKANGWTICTGDLGQTVVSDDCSQVGSASKECLGLMVPCSLSGGALIPAALLRTCKPFPHRRTSFSSLR